MRTKFLLALVIFSSLTFWATVKITPLNIKEGLWEMTVTHSMTGMPAIPPETLARMPPEQRARAEAAMKGGTTADVHKECVTKEKLEKQMAFDENRKDKDDDCIRTIVNATGSKLEMKFHCEKSSSDGTLLLEAATSDSVKGSMHIIANSHGRSMNMDLTFNSRYLGPACGDVK